jgi:predicted permease
MSWLDRIWKSLRTKKLQAEIQQELETHLGMLEDEAASEGLNAKDARTRARKQFGSLTAQVDQVRDVDSWFFLNDVRQDVRYALRQMRKYPGFAALAVGMTALGIASVTTIFSLVDAVLFHSLPYKDVSRLVYLWTPNSKLAGANIPQEIGPNYPDALTWQEESHSFSSMATVREHVFSVGRGDTTLRTGGAIVGEKFFQTLGVQPKLGRGFDTADTREGHGHVAVISEGLRRELFAGKSSALGQNIQLDRQPYEVIGVMPNGFGYPFEGDIPYGAAHYGQSKVWIPLTMSNATRSRVHFDSADGMIGRLRAGISAQQAQAELRTIETRLDALYPPELQGYSVLVRSLRDSIVGPAEVLLLVLLGAVGVVLLIVCGNVSNLLLARATTRAEELAIRVSLGAGRGRLIRQILTESMVISISGCCLGVLLSLAAIRLLLTMNPGNLPRFEATGLNWPVLGISIVVSVAAGLFFGLLPALTASKTNLNRELRKGGNRGAVNSSRLIGQILIAAEVGISFVLLIAAGLLIHSYLNLEAINPGYLRSTLTMNLHLDERYKTPEQRRNVFLNYLAKLRATPGISEAGAGSDIPLDNYESLTALEMKGIGTPKDLIDGRTITPGYFEAFGMRLLSGRGFEERDLLPDSRVMVVNQAFVRAFLGRRDPLTVQIRTGWNTHDAPWWRVIGVIGNRRHSKLEEAPRPEFYQPYWGSDGSDLHFVIRSALASEQLAGLARGVLHKLDPELTLDDVRTMDERMAEANARRRFQTTLLSVFGALAILLALGGIYGVLSYSVRQRTKEIGVRVALGAGHWNVLALILGQGLTPVLAGLAAGIATALFLTRLIRSWLYGVTAADPVTYGVLVTFVLLAAAIACYFPASAATRVDPVIAIRND